MAMTPLAYLESATKIDHGGHSSLTLRGHALNAGLDPGGGGGEAKFCKIFANQYPYSEIGNTAHHVLSLFAWLLKPPLFLCPCIAQEVRLKKLDGPTSYGHGVLGGCVMILDDRMGEMGRTCFDKHETRDYSYTCASATLESEDTIPLM